ncbi:MAG: hypothetical protein JSW66_11580 [Phycisphaerales bacterium]|nr:MAG: hypothetical protein JSW66_11580 [Phycisphaerales bacterium]
MIDYILGTWIPGPVEMIAILAFLGIPIVLVVAFLRLLIRNKKQNTKLRLEVGKVADELERLRKQKGTGQGEPSGESG